MSTTVVDYGPGAMKRAATIGWESADVRMRFEAISPDWIHADESHSIATIELDADNKDETSRRKVSVSIELTDGDLEALRDRITALIGERPRSAIEARTGIPLEELM